MNERSPAALANDEPSAAPAAKADRYSRQERFAPFGKEGQRKLRASHALIIGAGALGTGIAETLVRSGVGTLTIADRDYVEWSNLQRQQLFTESDAAQRIPKAIAARRRLAELNAECLIHAHVLDIDGETLEQLADGVDVIMDATDNFDTRWVINDMAQKLGVPWIYGGCVGSYGITFTIIPGETPCLNCLLGTLPGGGDTCDTAGILPQAVQMVTAHQTMEAFKLLSGHKEALRGKLLSFDVWRNEVASISVAGAKKEGCPSCGKNRMFPYLKAANQQKAAVLCGRDTVQLRPARRTQLDLQATAARLSATGDGLVESNPFLVSFTVGHYRLVIFEDGRTLIHGTNDIAKARILYSRYFG